jgi:hypothetical protein
LASCIDEVSVSRNMQAAGNAVLFEAESEMAVANHT